MRLALFFLALFPFAALADSTRFGIALETGSYPQATPKEALASVLKAIDAKKIDYLLAQLASPEFVNDRVKRIHGGKFEEQVKDTAARLDPPTIKMLKRFAADGKWTIDASGAVVTLDEAPDRQVRLEKKGDRWFLEHRFAPPR